MATEIEPKIETSARTEPAWKPYRLTVDQFLAMIDAGIFPHDAHVELLGGVLIQMMTKGDSRAAIVAHRTSSPAGGNLSFTGRRVYQHR